MAKVLTARGARPLSEKVRFASQAAREVPLAEFVPYRTQFVDDVLVTDKGDLVRSWRVDGKAFEAVRQLEIDLSKDQLNEMVRGIGGSRALWMHKVHLRTKDQLQGQYSNVLCGQFAEDYYSTFAGYSMMSTELFVTLVHRPKLSWIGKMTTPADAELVRERFAEELSALDQASQMVDSVLKTYGASRLATYSRDGIEFSEIQELFGTLLNGVREPIPLRRVDIAEYLPTSRLFFGLENIEIRAADGTTKFAGILDLADYPPRVVAGAFNPVAYKDFEFIETQSFSTMTSRQSLKALDMQKGHLMSSGDFAQNQIDDIDAAMEGVVDGTLSMGDYHYTLTIFGSSVDQVNKFCGDARATLQGQGFQSKRVDMVADAAWLAQLPCNWEYRPRKAQLTSRVFASLAPLHNINLGKRDGNPWGECVTILKTPSNKPFYFNFHSSPVDEEVIDKKFPGNTMIIGAIGSGKTALEAALLMLAQKFEADGVVFDKDRGLEIVVRSLGGRYTVIQRGESTGMNPLQSLEATPQNYSFLADLITVLVSGGMDRQLTPTETGDIDRALKAVMSLPRPARNLTVLYQNLPTNQVDGISQRLLRWCHGQALGWVFDNPIDNISLAADKWLGYDYTEILDDRLACTPVMMYLMHLSQLRKRGQPFISVVAEFWKAFENPYFEEYAKNGIKAERKLNAIMVLDTQSPSDAIEGPISKTLIEQTTTKIFLPNPEADRKDYIEHFKLTVEEFEKLRLLPPHGRTFLVKQGHQSWLARLDLSDPRVQKYLTLLSSTRDNVLLLDEIRAEYGDDPNVWVPILFDRVDARKSARAAVTKKG